jgi:RimJ/RimL family protein N-acetyltransferase
MPGAGEDRLGRCERERVRTVELRTIEIDDLPLYEGIHCDPRMMEHLGGPLPREGLADKLRLDVASAEAGDSWIFKIVPDDDPHVAAGTVCIWEHEWRGRPINEIGWMVLPAFQGRGLGSEAVRSILQRARAESRWDVVHAFPPVANARSGAMCRKMGFSWVDTCDFEFRDRILRCDHWQLDLRTGGPAQPGNRRSRAA